MTPGDFVRVTRGGWAGCIGVVLALVDGGYDVRLTSTGQVRWFGEDELRREKRTSELRAEARERLQSGESRKSLRERLRGAAA